jgi:hypothetical protein
MTCPEVIICTKMTSSTSSTDSFWWPQQGLSGNRQTVLRTDDQGLSRRNHGWEERDISFCHNHNNPFFSCLKWTQARFVRKMIVDRGCSSSVELCNFNYFLIFVSVELCQRHIKIYQFCRIKTTNFLTTFMTWQRTKWLSHQIITLLPWKKN